jgi:hypothetical protein
MWYAAGSNIARLLRSFLVGTAQQTCNDLPAAVAGTVPSIPCCVSEWRKRARLEACPATPKKVLPLFALVGSALTPMRGHPLRGCYKYHVLNRGTL